MRKQSESSGFTMIEVVIAGVILVSTMTAVAQMSVSALAGSKNRNIRTNIEDAINYDIQLLQKADSYLTYETLEKEGKEEEACADTTSYLINHLSKTVDNSELIARQIERTMKVGATADVIEVSYQFTAPETDIGTEYRFVELNPNFSAQCYTIQ
jgi:type II secretory pathway pseudopilin PulG